VKMVFFYGIDPGLSGGIASYDSVTGEWEVMVMPVVELKLGDGKKKRSLDHKALSEIFRDVDQNSCYAVLEEQHAMPRQGVASMFKTGFGFGALKQVLVDFNIPHEVVRAKMWQKEFGIYGVKGDTKEQARRICQDLFPGVNLLATPRSKKPHEGMVDAVLIAGYGRRRYGIEK